MPGSAAAAADAAAVLGVPDHVVLGVRPPGLAASAEVVVRTRHALEAGAADLAVAAVAEDAAVEETAARPRILDICRGEIKIVEKKKKFPTTENLKTQKKNVC